MAESILSNSTKQCTKCGQIKDLSEYAFRRDSGKFRNECKPCWNSQCGAWQKAHKEHRREYYRTNGDKIREQAAIRRAVNPAYKEYDRKWREENRDWVRERFRDYRDAHRDKFKEYEKKRYAIHGPKRRELSRLVTARHKQRDPEGYAEASRRRGRIHAPTARFRRKTRLSAVRCDFTREQWEQIKAFYANRCAFCGKKTKLTMDHVTPISKGGEHTAANIIPLCLPCNSSKKDRPVSKVFQPHLYMI